jgi:uncharacterized Zn finger protein
MDKQSIALNFETMPIPLVDRATIQRNATTKSFAKGESYYQADAVAALTQRGNLLHAEVEGTEAIPYRVTTQFDAGKITAARCTCPYDLEGWCKHIVAVLLACIHEPETIETRQSLEQLLDQLDLSQAKQVFRELIADRPDLIDDFDFQVNLITAVPNKTTQASSTKPKKSNRTIDPAVFRRQVKQLFRNAVRSWEDGYDEDPVTEDLLELVAEAEIFFQQGDGENAIAVLEGITQGCVDDWEDVDEYGADSDEIVAAIDYAWTQAILITEMTIDRQKQLRSQLQKWQEAWGQDLPMSIEALQQGWSYPPLLRVLNNGEITHLGAWEGEPPNFADELASIRLEILQRQGRDLEYLYLAEAEGKTEQYLTMLARLGRVEEVMTIAQTQMNTVDQAFALAKTLQQQGSIEQALEIAQTGLTLEGTPLYDLATWTSDLAESLRKPQIALTAKITAFNAKPSFQDYQKVEELAGEDWAGLRPEMLQSLTKHPSWGLLEAKVDIFLYEGEIDRAIETVTDLGYYHAPLIHRVIDAAISQRPDWVIENTRHRAEEIMNRGKSDAYQHAVEWLAKTKAAYQKSGRKPEWSAYYHQLLQTHERKRKLVGLLQKL